MPRLCQVTRSDADPIALAMYDALFGERDPVAEPGTVCAANSYFFNDIR